MAIARNEQLPKETREKIQHHVFEIESAVSFAVIHAAEAMFDLLVGFFLPRVPYPFAGLGLFPERDRKGGAQ